MSNIKELAEQMRDGFRIEYEDQYRIATALLALHADVERLANILAVLSEEAGYVNRDQANEALAQHRRVVESL